jgi:predicted nucleotidyltransferase/HEPN domain-containing protein
MRTDTDHLPLPKREELAEIVEILFSEFNDALKGKTAPHRKAGRILKIVLFGSYARGDWVSDPEDGYFSDYDLLVVVNHEELTDVVEYWAHADDRLVREEKAARRIRTPVGFIVHSLDDVNRQLRAGRYFFVDIVREGIALYESPGAEFEPAGKLSPAAARREAKAFFDEWFPSAEAFLKGAQYYRSIDRPKEAAFNLHQAVERLYHCHLLVRTLYSPKSHKLNYLRSQCEQLDPRLIAAWPRESRLSRRCFELLRRAYVEARYSPSYRITSDELNWLIDRTGILRETVGDICLESLQSQEGANQLLERPD